MKGVITDIRVDSEYERGHVITATVRLLGTPGEAHELYYNSPHREVEVVQAGSSPELSGKNFSDVKVGDQITYNFLRGGTVPEVSIWMHVKAVKGDVITASNNGPHGPYSFKIHRCQIVEHRPKGMQSRVVSKQAFDAEKHEKLGLLGEAPKKRSHTFKAGDDQSTMPDPLAEIRKNVMEFELT